jgi:hypothetical protein
MVPLNPFPGKLIHIFSGLLGHSIYGIDFQERNYDLV